MWTDRVRVLEEVAPADWIAGRLTGPMGTVVGTMPDGYPAYARVLHPAQVAHPDLSPDSEPVRWVQVAEVTGRRVHPTVQWHSLVGSDDPWDVEGGLWPHERPTQGNLAVGPLGVLCDVLAGHTTTGDDCLFALWEGWSQIGGARVRFGPGVARGGEPVSSVVSD